MNFDPNKWKVYTWKNWMVFHWIINPGLAFNELILGQRFPKLSLVDKESDKPLIERSYTPCPHCEEIHDSRTWSMQNGTAFKNWFGLYCPSCGEVIPCLKNVLTALILILLFPIWYFLKDRLRENWLKKQPSRYETLDLASFSNPFDGKGWIKQGLVWGLFMFVFMSFIFPFIIGDTIELRKVLVGIPIWTISGIFFGYSMKLIVGKKNKVKAANKRL